MTTIEEVLNLCSEEYHLCQQDNETYIQLQGLHFLIL